MKTFLKQFGYNIAVLTAIYFLLSFDSLLDLDFYRNYFTSRTILIIIAISLLSVVLKTQKRRKLKQINN